jgi:hypothetical protein
MKPDFIKWWTHNGNGPHRGTDLEYHEGSINQFAEDYARQYNKELSIQLETVKFMKEKEKKQEAIGFADYIDRNWYKWGYDKYTHPYAQVHNPKTVFFTKKELYQKYKDETTEEN